MRPILLAFLLGPLFRHPNLSIVAVAQARKISTLEYPVCRRNFTCSVSQFFPVLMADLNAEAKIKMAEPCENEANILGTNEGRKEALETVTKEKEEEKTKGSKKAPVEEKLPKLNAAEFRVYNSMAEHMDYFHNHFRQSWNMLYQSCTNNKRPSSMSLKQFINTGLQFCNHLSTHHAIEEQHIFPILAAKMPEFKQGANAAELLRQHKQIHEGMDTFEEYLRMCKAGETELDLRTLKLKMDTWGTVLWTHLDQEVKTLGAENMRKYWTVDEMKRMPM